MAGRNATVHAELHRRAVDRHRDRAATDAGTPRNLAQMLHEIPGFTDARRIGVDGMTPMARSLLQTVVPGASVADATPMLRELVRGEDRGRDR